MSSRCRRRRRISLNARVRAGCSVYAIRHSRGRRRATANETETFACAVLAKHGWEQAARPIPLPLTLPGKDGEALPAWHRTLVASLQDRDDNLTVASFHVVPGSRGRNKWLAGVAKAMFFRSVASWLSGVRGPAVVGIDANSPKWDRPVPQPGDFWCLRREGDQDEHLVLDPRRRAHLLRDALRDVYLSRHPKEASPREEGGPLAVSHSRRGQAGSRRVPCRYDHIYVTSDIDVLEKPVYREDTIWGSNDHALAIARLRVHSPG